MFSTDIYTVYQFGRITRHTVYFILVKKLAGHVGGCTAHSHVKRVCSPTQKHF